MSKKNSVAAIQKAIDKAQSQRARTEEKLKRDKKKAAGLREQVRQMEVAAARHGVDLDKTPAEQARADFEVTGVVLAKTKAERAAEEERRAEARAGRSTAELMAEHIAANTYASLHYTTMRPHGRPSSAEKLAHEVVLGLDSTYSDPSRNTLPTGAFLRPTREVVAAQRGGQPLQPQYRPPAQTRIVPPQATTRNPLHRPWGAAPGQLGGVKLTQGGGR